VLEDDVTRKPYGDILEEGLTPPPGIQIMTRNAFVDEDAVPTVLQILAEAGASERPPVMAIRSVGGAVSRVPADATAYAHRSAELMFVTTYVGPPPAIEAARPAMAKLWAGLAPHTNGAYANFLTDATDEDVAEVYPPETYQRLAAVKRQYDPDNHFAGNHNVQPR
jgi:hypothetical protein